MNEYEAIMIDEQGQHMIVSAWGASLDDATRRATETVTEDFPGWTVTLTGDSRVIKD